MKTEIMVIRVDKRDKIYLEKAAAHFAKRCGLSFKMNLSAFVLASAMEDARRELKKKK